MTVYPPVITFSDDVDEQDIASVLNLLAGRRVVVTCSDDSQTTGEIRSSFDDVENLHILTFDDDDKPQGHVSIAIDMIEEVIYL